MKRLGERGFAAMCKGLVDSDLTNQIVAAWIAKEELRKLLALARTGADRELISRRLHAFYDWCASLDIDQLAHARDDGRDLVAGDPGVHRDRHYQRQNRGLN